MTEDGANDLAHTRPLAEAKVTEVEASRRPTAASGTWPRLSTVLKALLFAVAALIVGGWILTSLNAGS